MKRCMGCMETYKEDVFICPYCGYEENSMPEESFHLVPGSILGKRYQIGKVLGFGGFGVTYIGLDMLLEKKVAIKEYLPSEFATRMPAQTNVSVYSGEKTEQFEAGMDKFVEEARKLAKFNETEGIVNVYDCITENNTAYIIMEYLEGESLKKRLDREKKLSLEEVERIIIPILNSLQSVHEVGLIHRDIAPDNIFLTVDGRVKLLDFGAARYASATHSRSLSVIYKPGYAPIEQYQSRGNQGAWTDVYALAATMYKMLTGVTLDTSIERNAKDGLKFPSKLGAQIPKNKETALLNALNIRPEERTQSARQFLEEWNSQGTVVRLVESIKKVDVGTLSKKAKIIIFSSIAATGLLFALVLGMGGFRRIAAEISMQSGETRVPMVVNDTVDGAQIRAVEAGLLLEIVGREYSDEIKRDLVLKQSMQGGSLTQVGNKLGVTVSGGVQQIYMPAMSGSSESYAIASLEKEGFSVSKIEEFSEIIAPGNVIRTSIAAGVQCDLGTSVTIYVSKGMAPTLVIENAEKYVVENYVGMTVEEVSQTLSGTGVYLDYSQKAYSDTMPEGTVVAQVDSIGTELEVGSTIKITVSLGKQKIRIPYLVYKEKAKAEADIAGLLKDQELGQDALVIKWIESFHPSVKAGLIISQSIEEGKEVDKGSVLTLTVSKGPEPANTVEKTPQPHVHNYEWQVSTTVKETCTTQGQRAHSCSCGESWIEMIPMSAHSEIILPGKAATCTSTGITEGKKCSVCDTVIVAQTQIAKNRHAEIILSGKAATCTATGLTEGKKCSVCEAVLVEQQEIPMLQHSYDGKTDLNCNGCDYVRGYWTEWVDNGVGVVDASETRQVKTEVVSVTVYTYRYNRYTYYNSAGTFCSTRMPPLSLGYTAGSGAKGTKTYTINYSGWYNTPIPVVYKDYGSGVLTSTYDCGGTTYYTEETVPNTSNEIHYFYRDVIYY